MNEIESKIKEIQNISLDLSKDYDFHPPDDCLSIIIDFAFNKWFASLVCNFYGRSYANYMPVDVKDENCKKPIFGNGESILEALNNLEKEILRIKNANENSM